MRDTLTGIRDDVEAALLPLIVGTLEAQESSFFVSVGRPAELLDWRLERGVLRFEVLLSSGLRGCGDIYISDIDGSALRVSDFELRAP